MTTRETERDGLQYFDTSCLLCGKIVETCVKAK
jgi:hypothetical protein